MDKTRTDKWQQLIDLLNQADALQQKLLGDVDEFACYEFHQSITAIAEDFEEWAAAEQAEAQEG